MASFDEVERSVAKKKRIGNPARGRSGGNDNAAERVAKARAKLEQLEEVAPPFSIAYFGVEPQWLTDDLDQPLTGETYMHSEDQLSGRMVHLPGTHRGRSMTEASQNFIRPFIAVPRWEELPLNADTHAVVTAGANWSVKPVRDGLRIMQAVRRISRLHFSAMMGLDIAEGEYVPKDPDELNDLMIYISARMQLEVTIATEPYRALALSMDHNGWLASEIS